jgi:hypothetical protein
MILHKCDQCGTVSDEEMNAVTPPTDKDGNKSKTVHFCTYLCLLGYLKRFMGEPHLINLVKEAK